MWRRRQEPPVPVELAWGASSGASEGPFGAGDRQWQQIAETGTARDAGQGNQRRRRGALRGPPPGSPRRPCRQFMRAERAKRIPTSVAMRNLSTNAVAACLRDSVVTPSGCPCRSVWTAMRSGLLLAAPIREAKRERSVWRFPAMRYARTIRHLRPRQVAFQVLRRLRRASVGSASGVAPALSPPPRWPARVTFPVPACDPANDEGSVLSGVLQFHSRRESVGFPPAWNRTDLPRSWLYHLHSHEFLWRLTFRARAGDGPRLDRVLSPRPVPGRLGALSDVAAYRRLVHIFLRPPADSYRRRPRIPDDAVAEHPRAGAAPCAKPGMASAGQPPAGERGGPGGGGELLRRRRRTGLVSQGLRAAAAGVARADPARRRARGALAHVKGASVADARSVRVFLCTVRPPPPDLPSRRLALGSAWSRISTEGKFGRIPDFPEQCVSKDGL